MPQQVDATIEVDTSGSPDTITVGVQISGFLADGDVGELDFRSGEEIDTTTTLDDGSQVLAEWMVDIDCDADGCRANLPLTLDFRGEGSARLEWGLIVTAASELDDEDTNILVTLSPQE